MCVAISMQTGPGVLIENQQPIFVRL
jgi:hypothetical protein